MTESELLARLILCEAGGEGDTGMRAVATVILNRITATEGEYGRQNSLQDVLYAIRQFACISNANQNIYNVVPTSIHYEIANWALSGGRLGAVENALWFYAPYELACKPFFPNDGGSFLVRIGGHCFYVPNKAYFAT